jgi:hypothetical protein
LISGNLLPKKLTFMKFIPKILFFSLFLCLSSVIANAQTTTSGPDSKISKSEINIRENETNEKAVKSLSEEEKGKIFMSRGYPSWHTEFDGMIQFSKMVPRIVTVEDVVKSKKYWGTNTEEDKRFTQKDIGKKFLFPKRGFLDSKSLLEVITPIYDELDHRFKNGKVLAFDGKKYFIINKKGEIVYPEKLKEFTFVEISGSYTRNISELGYRVVKNKLGKYGFVNEEFDLVIPCLYDNVDNFSKAYIAFSNGFCLARLNNKKGFLNKSGVFKVINAESFGGSFNNEGITVFTLNKKQGVIDTNGVVVIAAKYDEVDLRGSNYTVKNGLKYGVIDNRGKVIVPIAYSHIINVGALEQIQVKVGSDYRYYKDLELIAQQSTEKSNQPRSSLIEGSGSANKTTINSNQSLEYDFSELKSQGCDVIKSEFKQFAIKFISYKKRVKSNPSSLSFREDTDWENNLRKFSDLATTCAIKLKGNYALEVLGYMEKVSALLPIEPVVSSSSRNSSYAQNKSTSVTAKKTCTKCGNGFEIKDFNESTRQYSNTRRETKIGFIPCNMCQGTKKMSVTAGSSYKGKGCTSCRNTGWEKCDMSSSGH